jgi:iron complex transport system substrate-binding protein
MRIASLVPSATEFLFALGLGDDVVAVTHECDYPLDVLTLPQLTRSVLEPGLEPAAIDSAVRERVESGKALYELDEELLAEVEPDLIVTQALCDVCAVAFDDVQTAAQRLEEPPRVISLDASTLGEVLGCIRTIGQACDAKDAGVDLLRELADRMDAVKLAVRTAGRADGPPRPMTLAVEWLDPPYTAGHWVPQMIDLAGGVDPFGMPGEKSQRHDWDELAVAEPDIVVLMQCGYTAGQCAEQALDHAQELRALGAQRIVAAEAMAHFSRPGPRLIDGLEQLAHVLHPELVEEPAAGRLLQVDLD